MPYDHDRPDFYGDERTQLVGWLDLQRKLVRWKCEGLSNSDAYRVVIPTSPLMSLRWMLIHMIEETARHVGH